MKRIKKDETIAIKASKRALITNIILSVIKILSGVFATSLAMISDGIHSLSDVFSTLIVIIGVKMASRKADKDHPYGHERFECVAAIILSIILFGTGLYIGINGIMKIFSSDTNKFLVPGILALIVALISIVVKEIMYRYIKDVSKKLDSPALLAEAWHHRSDALSSIGSFVGILGARAGFPSLDTAASVIISFFIIKVAFDIFKSSINKMTDTACDEEMEKAISDAILKNEDVLGIDKIKTRQFGNRIYIDIEISCNGNASLNETHNVAHEVHDYIENNFPKVKHCMVHVNPAIITKKD